VKDFDEREEGLITCQHCGEMVSDWWLEETGRCPECGEMIFE
jgi:DNA-directed RNA polymerase subunit RPC12/RpoP